MSIQNKHVMEIGEGETENCSVDGTDWLDGASFTGTPTITEVTTTDLTLTNKAVSSAELTILDNTVAAGSALQFTVSGQQAGTTYRVLLACDTDDGFARTVSREQLIKVV